MDTALGGLRSRWLTYFRERFPLLGHGVPIALFVTAGELYARAQQGQAPWPGLPRLAVAFVTVFLVFLQLRILDEFKDYAEDARYRPERPVPRGLVTLRQLGTLGLAAAVVQLFVSSLLGLAPVTWLVVVWAYAWLMRVEFMVPQWLRAHPVAYMGSHVVIIPLMLFYVAACADVAFSPGALLLLALLSYATFCVFEIGRKIRAPADEREGVDMYSQLWGLSNAVSAWMAVLIVASVLLGIVVAALLAQAAIGVLLALPLPVVAGVLSLRFLADPRPGAGSLFMKLSGAWVLYAYFVVAATVIAVSAWNA